MKAKNDYLIKVPGYFDVSECCLPNPGRQVARTEIWSQRARTEGLQQIYAQDELFFAEGNMNTAKHRPFPIRLDGT
jgi:hypothetical protein